MPLIRPSNDHDLPAITAIYEHHVLTGTGTFETMPPTLDEMQARRADVLSKQLPYLVLEHQEAVAGFCYCNWFKPRPAYRFSAEDSIYLASTAAGKGWGRLLLNELMASAQRAGIRKLIAVIGDSNNHASIGLHAAAGFRHVGILTDCGWKFDRWLDVVLMECPLGAGSALPAPQSVG
jgi:phosphinothricin acetyltransferase